MLLLCLAVVATGCLTRTPPAKLAKVTPVAVAIVVDDEYSGKVSAAPPAFEEAVAKALAEQNLELRPVPFESFEAATRGRRDSQSRMKALVQLAGDAPFQLLVETKVVFFSQLSGKYRWDVSAKASANKRGLEGDPLINEVHLPALLQYDHERVPEALEYTAPQIADRIASLFASLIGASPTASAPPKPATGDAIYFVMVDRFANGDVKNDGEINAQDPAAFHGGDLQGVMSRLDWLQEMGVRTVWLSPVFKMRTRPFFGYGAFHGYWTEDLNRVEPRFGNTEQLARLSDELHRRGMRLVLDLVLNHVAMDSPLTRKHPDWFHGKGPLKNWNDEEELNTHDVHGLPDLAQERPEVYAHLSNAAFKWGKTLQLDGFRLDAVKHVPIDFWAKFNRDTRKQFGERFLVLGEMLDGDPKVLSRTQREGAFGAMFDFPLAFALTDVFCRDQAALKLAAVFSSDRIYEDPESLVTLIDNHDLPRVMSTCGNDVERVKGALTMLLTARGTPALQYGTEVGLTGEKEPENRGDMNFDVAHPLREHISRLMALRSSHPALQHGAVRVLRADERVFAYARVAPEEVAVIAVNRGSKPVTLTLPPDLAGELKDGLSGRALRGASVEVQPRGTAVALVSPAVARGFEPVATAARKQWLSGGKTREVEFVATGLPLRDGDQAYIAGSGPELGAWNPARALGPLDRSGRVRATLPVEGAFEYKLVVKRADGSSKWEEGKNRALFVAEADDPLPLQLAWEGKTSR